MREYIDGAVNQFRALLEEQLARAIDKLRG